MRKIVFYYFVTTMVIPFSGIFLAVASKKNDRFLSNICTRYCHGTGGCRHDAALPDIITADEHLYGDIIRGLFDIGEVLSSLLEISYFQGYGLANLLIFCLAVPIAHFSMMLITLFFSRGRK